MRYLLIGIMTGLMAMAAPALAGPCDGLKLDLDKGTLGSVGVKTKLADVKKALPCAPEQSESMNGISLYFAKQGFYIEPGQNITVYTLETPFKGSLSQNILGKPAKAVETLLGASAYSAQEEAEAAGSFYSYAFYSRPWGTLVLKYSPKGLLEELTLSSTSLDKLKVQYPEAGAPAPEGVPGI